MATPQRHQVLERICFVLRGAVGLLMAGLHGEWRSDGPPITYTRPRLLNSQRPRRLTSTNTNSIYIKKKKKKTPIPFPFPLLFRQLFFLRPSEIKKRFLGSWGNRIPAKKDGTRKKIAVSRPHTLLYKIQHRIFVTVYERNQVNGRSF
jgi:hypothetical protein